MADLVTPLNDLDLGTTKNSTTSTTTSNNLGKDEFLKLLVTQMQYQDPLEPQTDSDFIAQLAQFSSLEQMQNLNSTVTNSQAYSLVGKEVEITTTDSLGKSKTVTGTVDFVTISNGTSYVSVDGTKYSVENITKVMDDYYVVKGYLPTVTEKKAEYDTTNPTDITFDLSLGSNGYEASSVAVAVNGNAIDSKYLSFEDGKLTIDKAALTDLEPGNYVVAFYFDDTLKTTVTDKASIQVTKGSTENSNS